MSRSSGRISNATEETPSMTKEIRKERRKIVNDLCLTLHPYYKSKKKDHGSIKQFIDDKKLLCNWLTKDSMHNDLRRMKSDHSIPDAIPDEVANESSISSITNPNEANESSESSDYECVALGESNNEPKRRGRPKGAGRSCRMKLDSVIKSARWCDFIFVSAKVACYYFFLLMK